MKRLMLAFWIVLTVGCSVPDSLSHSQGPLWQSLNEFLPSHTTVNTVARAIGGESRFYAGTYDKVGLYTSIDGCTDWHPDRTGLPEAPVFSLLPMPAEMFAGTASGLYRRAYTAEYWQRADPIPQVAIYDLTLDSAGAIYVATDTRGIWKSEDAGTSWTRLPGLEDEPLLRILVPDRGQTILAGTAGHGLFITRDGGATWDASPQFAQSYIPMLSRDPGLPGVLYVGPRGGVYRSLDGGVTWEALGGGIEKEPVYALIAYTDEENIHWLLAGTAAKGLLKSRDGGRTWLPQTTAGASPFLPGRAVLAITKQGNQILVGTADSVVIGSVDKNVWDSGEFGQSAIGAPAARDLALRAGDLWVAADDGLFAYARGTNAWRNDGGAFPAPVSAVGLASSDSSRIYVGTDGKGVFTSTDNGLTWSAATGELGGRGRIAQLVVDPKAADVVYARVLFGRIFKSADGGESWQPIWTGMPVEEQIQSMAIAPGDSKIMYAGGDTQFYYSKDGGATWVPRGLDSISTLALWVNPLDANEVWAGATDGLYQSGDGGQSWRGPFLKGITVSALERGKNGAFLVGTLYHGLYWTDTRATSFVRLGGGLESASVRAIVSDNAAEVVYTATDAGLFCMVFNPDQAGPRAMEGKC